jgi:hypothetical protein
VKAELHVRMLARSEIRCFEPQVGLASVTLAGDQRGKAEGTRRRLRGELVDLSDLPVEHG